MRRDGVDYLVAAPPEWDGHPGVVLVHGLGCHRDECHGFFAALAHRLAGHGVPSVRFDLPGHASRTGAPEPFTLDRCVREVLVAVDLLATEYPVDAATVRPERARPGRPLLFGASFGGAVALMATALAGHRVGGLVVLGAVSDLRLMTDTDKARERGLAEALAEGRDVRWDWGVTIDPVLNEELHTIDLGALVERIDAPVTLVHGERDDVVPLAASVSAAARIDGARLVVLPETGHVFAAVGDEDGTSARSLANLDLLEDLLRDGPDRVG